MSARDVGDGVFTQISLRFATVEQLRTFAGDKGYDAAISWLLANRPGNGFHPRDLCGIPNPKNPGQTCRRRPGHPENHCKWWSHRGEVTEWITPHLLRRALEKAIFHVERRLPGSRD
jgi:hypothetical protein